MNASSKPTWREIHRMADEDVVARELAERYQQVDSRFGSCVTCGKFGRYQPAFLPPCAAKLRVDKLVSTLERRYLPRWLPESKREKFKSAYSSLLQHWPISSVTRFRFELDSYGYSRSSLLGPPTYRDGPLISESVNTIRTIRDEVRDGPDRSAAAHGIAESASRKHTENAAPRKKKVEALYWEKCQGLSNAKAATKLMSLGAPYAEKYLREVLIPGFRKNPT